MQKNHIGNIENNMQNYVDVFKKIIEPKLQIPPVPKDGL